METDLTISSVGALLVAMIVLAAMPSVSVLTVVARSASLGFRDGLYTTVGIVIGDIVLIVLAVSGLSLLAGSLGRYFALVEVLGGAYLIWLGVHIWRSKPATVAAAPGAQSAPWSSLLAGLLITLGDLKAIVFYLGFLPAFVDLRMISLSDTVIIILITSLAVGGTKLTYALLADRARTRFAHQGARGIRRAAGGTLIGVGAYLVAKQ